MEHPTIGEMIALTGGERAVAEALATLEEALTERHRHQEAQRVRDLRADLSVEATQRINDAIERPTIIGPHYAATAFRHPMSHTVEFHEPADPPTLERYATYVHGLAAAIRAEPA